MSKQTTTLDWLLKTPSKDIYNSFDDTERRAHVVPAIECADGTKLSVQASRTHYCAPRDCDGSWYEVEVMLPVAAAPASWKAHQDGEGSNVYAYVPVELVREFIAAHGGERKEVANG